MRHFFDCQFRGPYANTRSKWAETHTRWSVAPIQAGLGFENNGNPAFPALSDP
jgi:hypothetical protein